MLEQSFDWSREWMSEWMADPKNRGGVLCNTSQCSLSVTRLFYTQTLCRTVEALKRRLVAYWVLPRAWTFTGQAGCNRCGWGGSSSSNTLHCSVHVIPTQISVLLNIDVFYPNLKMGAVKENNVLNFIVHLWTLVDNEKMCAAKGWNSGYQQRIKLLICYFSCSNQCSEM